MAAAIGALAAGASPARIEALASFGRELGVGLQMMDDLGSLTSAERAEKAAEDLRGGRPTWPWAWAAQDCAAAAYAELVRCAHEVATGTDPDSLARRLAARVGESGRARARAQLSHAFCGLRASCGASAALEAVEQDFRRLEESYV
jgi:geranylgeranyl pyrophosphate synthase